MAIGEHLRNLRTQRNLSIRSAAKLIGISASRLQELETGISRTTGKRTSPTTDALFKIAQAYDQPAATLLELAGLVTVTADAAQEAELIQVFRRLDSDGRDLLVSIARVVEARSSPRQG